jgi:hypothetical protein
MTTESLEALRRRLLQRESVQRMIQIRAYEIYQMRGCQPGGEAQDWFHAEGEVLAFLIAGESAQNDVHAMTGSYLEEEPEIADPQSVSEKKRTTAKPVARRTAEGSQVKRQSTASKRTSTKKSSKPKAKSTRSRKNSKPESTE